MNGRKLRSAMVELLAYFLVSFLTCLVVDLILRRDHSGSTSVRLWTILPGALAVTFGVWLGKVFSGIALTRKKPGAPER